MIRKLLLCVCLLSGLQASALPKIKVEKINGFEVHFVDIGAGNSFGVSFQVPYGSLHDHGRFLGRAHLLEHLLHVGSVRYPGYHAFDEQLHPAGIDSNASTSWNRTFYYAGAKDDQAELMLKVFLSMLGGLEWDPVTVEKERQIVINEIVQEGLPQESDAFIQMPFTKLLPGDHPWNHPMLGDLPSLTGLSIDDLKDLYNQVYRPEAVKVALHGNFSDPAFLSQVRRWTRQNLKASPEQLAPLKEKQVLAARQIPSMFSDDHDAPESQRRLYLHSEHSMSGGIFLEADTRSLPANSQAMNVLSHYLAMELPGSFLHHLKTELGWINEGSFFGANVRERQLLVFNYTLTEKGRGKTTEINEMFFRALKAAQDTDVESGLLERMKKRFLHDLEISSRSVGSFLTSYASALNSKKSFAAQIEDLKTVSPRDVRSAALLFRPDQALYVEAGPEVPEMEFDPTYKRKYKLYDNRAQLQRYVNVLREPAEPGLGPVLKEVGLGAPGAPAQPLFLTSKPGSGDRFTLDLRQGLPDAALSLEFQLQPESAEDLVALDLIADAFEERYASEITYLNYNYFVSLGSARTTRSFSLTASGDDAYAARALRWKIEKLADFVPTPEELSRARESYADDRLNTYIHEFSAILGFREAKAFVDPLDAGIMTGHKLALGLNHQKVAGIWRRLRQKADRNLVAVGNVPLSEVEKVHAAAKRWSPALLNGENLKAINWMDEVREVQIPFALSKGADSYALVRFYKGPEARHLKEATAFMALNSLLSGKIYTHNRGDQQLGYIHSSTVKNFDNKHLYLGLYGGTEGRENADKTVAGWMHIFEQIKTGVITDEEIRGALSAVVNDYSRQNTTAREWVSTYMAGLSMHQDPRAARLTLAAARSLTPEDVREVARRYLLGDGTPYTQLTLHGCEDVLLP